MCLESSRLLASERQLWWLPARPGLPALVTQAQVRQQAGGGQVAGVQFMREALLVERLRMETSAPAKLRWAGRSPDPPTLPNHA